MTILITGGNGVLGRELRPRLRRAGHTVRIMSRGPAPAKLEPGYEWAQVDLTDGRGLGDTLAGVEAVVHAASDAFDRRGATDVAGTERLVAAAERAGVGHLVYISIVGIDKVPYRYYQHKLAAEQHILAGDVPWTIWRTTQFHNLLDIYLSQIARLPVLPLPRNTPIQPLDVAAVAEGLAQAVADGPSGRLPDAGGPEILQLDAIIRSWLQATGRRRLLVPIPAMGALLRGYRAGHNLAPDNKLPTRTWSEWLAAHKAVPRMAPA